MFWKQVSQLMASYSMRSVTETLDLAESLSSTSDPRLVWISLLF